MSSFLQNLSLRRVDAGMGRSLRSRDEEGRRVMVLAPRCSGDRSWSLSGGGESEDGVVGDGEPSSSGESIVVISIKSGAEFEPSCVSVTYRYLQGQRNAKTSPLHRTLYLRSAMGNYTPLTEDVEVTAQRKCHLRSPFHSVRGYCVLSRRAIYSIYYTGYSTSYLR